MNLESGLNKEWILTNGIGGYSYSTTIGCNTRKYHGLLVAPLTPPARRHVILSKLDEAIEIIKRDSRRYAKRQLTWFRHKDNIIWINGLQDSQIIINQIITLYEKTLI